MGLKNGWQMLKETFQEFSDDDCAQMAGALAYFTILSLPPLLFLIIHLAGFFFGNEAAQGEIQRQLGGMIGTHGAAQIETMIRATQTPAGGGLLGQLLGLGALLLGASGAMMQIQKALNKAWEVAPDPNQGGIKTFIVKRVFSFSIVLVIAFLLLVSLVLSAMLTAFGDMLNRMLGGMQVKPLFQVLDVMLSFGIITLLFAAIFRIMPDARVTWREVWVGAAVTALLFTVGKFLIGFYLGHSNVGSAFGAAGSLVIVLVWIYYSASILLIGAEFTQTWIRHQGKRIEPEPGAVKVIKEVRRVPQGSQARPQAGPQGGPQPRLA